MMMSCFNFKIIRSGSAPGTIGHFNICSIGNYVTNIYDTVSCTTLPTISTSKCHMTFCVELQQRVTCGRVPIAGLELLPVMGIVLPLTAFLRS